MRVASRRRHPSTESFRNLQASPKRTYCLPMRIFFLFYQSDASRPSTSSRHDATRDARARRATRPRARGRASARRRRRVRSSALERRDDARVRARRRRRPRRRRRAPARADGRRAREVAKVHARGRRGARAPRGRMDRGARARVRHHGVRDDAPGIQQRGAGVDGAGDRAGARERGER